MIAYKTDRNSQTKMNFETKISLVNAKESHR